MAHNHVHYQSDRINASVPWRKVAHVCETSELRLVYSNLSVYMRVLRGPERKKIRLRRALLKRQPAHNNHTRSWEPDRT